MTAFIFFVFTKASTSKRKKFRVLYLSKPIFNQDVKALISNSKEFEYYFFPRLLLSTICKLFISNFDELNDANYHPLTKDSEGVINLRNFLRKFINAYLMLLKFDIVLAGNFVYTQQQEFFWVLKERNIPVVVIYKEGMFPINRYDEMIDIFYKTKEFRGEKILLYNQKIRDTLLKAAVPGITKENSVVVGIPRFDNYFEKSNIKENSHLIVLFSFEADVKSNYLLDNPSNKAEFDKISKKFHQIFAEFCIKNKKYKLIVKTKSTPTAISYANNIYQEYQETLGNQLIITSTKTAEKLIRSARFIAAYSSTTLIEALLLDKILICPDFRKLMKSKSQDILYPHTSLANYLNTARELEDVIVKGISNQIYSEKTKLEFLKNMVFRADGKVSERVEYELLSIMKERNRG
ncbi:hypothetical protein EB822_10755 [Flavobacteriaceae bacterium PRS1]|nr:hypothetical protein EB822_10755 [Flavobacteriaceae bacterium PRS1]